MIGPDDRARGEVMLKDLAGKAQRAVARNGLRTAVLEAIGNSTTDSAYNGSTDG